MFKKIIVGLAIIVILVIGAVYIYLRSFLPDYSTDLKVAGIGQPIVIERNRYAVPSITAQSEEDLYFAWGYVNAQDRMFQMEFTRRVAQGRISEFAGESGYEKDYFLKAVGFYEIAVRDTENMSPEIKRYLKRYVDGINYYLDTEGTPLYMKLLGMKREPWKLADTAAVAMMLNWSLAYNMKHELLYHRMQKKIGEEKTLELLKSIPPGTPTIIDDRVSNYLTERQPPVKRVDLGWLLGCRSASNGWVIGPQKSAYRGNLFSSDMQVHNSKMPNDFYLVHVKAGPFEVAGAQVVGLPFVASGYSRKFAWGLTNNGADTVDLFAETIDWDRKTYRFRGKDYPLGTKEIEIKIKGKEPVKKTVYYVGKKPILNEVFKDLDFDVSLYWTGFDKTDVEGFFHMNRAMSHEEFLRGAKMVRISPQNMVYADAEGNIGYRVIGSLPLREQGTGNLIQNGERFFCNWNGNIPEEDYPEVYNPERGFIVTANNKVSKDTTYDFNGTYAPGYRYENIARLIRERDRIDVDYFKQMQTDIFTVLASKVQGLIRRHVTAGNEIEKKAFDKVLQWDGQNRIEDAGPTIYNTFYVRLFFHVLSDELGDDLASEYIIERYISQERLFKLLEENSVFIDDVTTAATETLDDIATRAFRDTVNILESFFSSTNPDDWRWGEIHQIKFDHVLGKSALLKPLVDYGPFPFEGDGETNNRARFYEVEPPFIAGLASAPRIVVKFDPEPKGYMMLITGESEYFLSKHNTDMTDAWRQHEFFSVEDSDKIYKMIMNPK